VLNHPTDEVDRSALTPMAMPKVSIRMVQLYFIMYISFPLIVSGEGLGLVLLKRLSDAERDGDRIYCVLRDVFTNHDGSEGKNNFVVPSPVGQTRLLADIYKRAKFDTQRIFYVEAHGTGTPVGDPIEANSLGRFFNRSPLDPPLLIGSVKSNLGHTEGTAGVAALIKVALSMHYRAVPPNMHFTALNPRIEAQRYNLHIVQHIVPFPPPDNDNPVAIGINSFSMGGNNAHAIVEEYRPRPATMLNQFSNGHTPDKQGVHKQHFIFIISSKFM
jgi:acyl transferase domain-containing protein